MIPIQTAVDSVLDGVYLAAESFVADYWWAIMVVVVAFYVRMYVAAKGQDEVDVPAARAIPLVLRKFREYAVSGLKDARVVLSVLSISFYWMLQATETLSIGLASGDPTVWATLIGMVMTTFSGLHGVLFDYGFFQGYSGILEQTIFAFTPVQIVFGFSLTYITIVGIRMLAGSQRVGSTSFIPQLRGYGFLEGSDGGSNSGGIPFRSRDAGSDDDGGSTTYTPPDDDD